MNIVIDIGNSAAKLVVFGPGGEPVAEVRTPGGTLSALPDVVARWQPRRAIVASVADLTDCANAALEALPCPLLRLKSTTPVPLRVAYDTPTTLGVDRLAAAVGAAGLRPGSDVLVIDAGTCITYDRVDASGCYRGGNISPGIGMRLLALHEHTARLPLVEAEGKVPPEGHDTPTAIRAGVVWGVRHEVEGYIRHYRAKYPDISVFLTGGDAECLQIPAQNGIFADPYLVPRGLNRILLYHDQL